MLFSSFIIIVLITIIMNRNTNQNPNQNTNRNVNVLYYSKVAKSCLDLLKIIESYGILNKFVLKCIDDMDEKQIPPQLTDVPTVLINGIDKPLIGREAFKWFQDNRQYLMAQSAEQHSKQIVHNMTKIMNLGPKGFSGELTGTSDEFAYCDIDDAQPKSYCKDVEDGNVIITPPKDKKLTQMNIKNMSREIEHVRKEQEKELSEMMKQDQINRIMSIEREKLMKNRLGI